MKILVADDNRKINNNLSEYLKTEGYQTVSAFDGEEVLRLFEAESPDIILLDIMMPKIDGFEVCRKIRAISMIPVIMITARGEDFERVMGLDIGADDYIVKPFSSAEIVARIKALFRRITPQEELSQQTLNISNLSVDLDRYIVKVDNHKLELTKKEVDILWTLATNHKKVFTRDNLLDSVWGYDYYGDNRTVDTHIKRLRAKLDKLNHPEWEIRTIRGVGYKFEVNDEE